MSNALAASPLESGAAAPLDWQLLAPLVIAALALPAGQGGLLIPYGRVWLPALVGTGDAPYPPLEEESPLEVGPGLRQGADLVATQQLLLLAPPLHQLSGQTHNNQPFPFPWRQDFHWHSRLRPPQRWFGGS